MWGRKRVFCGADSCRIGGVVFVLAMMNQSILTGICGRIGGSNGMRLVSYGVGAVGSKNGMRVDVLLALPGGRLEWVPADELWSGRGGV
jgi:hypothetical protein